MPPSDDILPPAGHPQPVADAAAPPRPSRLLLRALLWLLAAQIAALGVAFLIAFFAALFDVVAGRIGVAGWEPTPLGYALSATVALQVALLWADFRQGRLLGNGSLTIGLGAGPIRRRGLIVLFVVLIIAWVLAYVAALAHFQAFAARLASDVPTALTLPESPSILLLMGRLFLIAVMAPVAEELFFRGWLWTALRRSWGAWPTALCTGGLWLVLHALTGAIRVPILVPAAILLSLARHYGGSVRASIPIHIANNGTAVAIQLIALVFAPH